ncbi:hypothetical protein [Pseudomonas segetis]|uniref:Uncharacterized protein n=1 Tax=Pseudomonas segetis TaxID=298908 RepID=A0A239C9Q5_9PSED|nr:hypothetical protein [Pseudomonas segetis]SNS16830.1 hypothetical protein SAMN05216255_1583 [Pseudomonas segetis]
MSFLRRRGAQAIRAKVKAESGGRDATADSVLNVLFGEYNNDYQTEYSVTYINDPYIETTVIQRINLFWVWPIMLVTAPIRFVLTGSMGVSPSKPFGLMLQRLIGRF